MPRHTILADEEFRGQTIHKADPNHLTGVTVLVRLVHGAVHFIETNQHLDEKGITFCSGSCLVDGCVPGVDWLLDNRVVFMCRYPLGVSHRAGGVRRAVSLPKQLAA